MSKNAYKVKALQELGVDVTKLGCVMLKFRQLPVKNWLPDDWAYFAKDPRFDWVKGLDVKSHATLLYGLLEKAFIWYDYVNEVLEGWEPAKDIFIKEIEVFPSTIEGEDYSCLVGRVESYGNLEEANQLLRLLPHIDTFPYKPHVTLGYVNSEYTYNALGLLHQHGVPGYQLEPQSISYGGDDL